MMARSITEIQQSIIDAKDTISELSELNSTSQTAIWRLWVYVVAVAIWMHEQFFDVHKAEVEVFLAQAPPGSPSWYVRKCLEFQYGDVLTIVNDSAQYATIDASKRIITRASFRENGNSLFLKVAKNNQGALQALDSSELLQLEGYIDRIKFAGVQTNISSLNADKLRLYAEIYFDASYEVNTYKDGVRNAINTYLANLAFDGNVLVSRIVDAIQSVEGTIDVFVYSCEGYSGVNLEAFTRIYETKSGYIVEDDALNFSFLDTLTFIAQ